MFAVRDEISQEIAPSRLERAGELGVLRLMMKFDKHFTKFLESPAILAIVDQLLSPTAILHLQNGFILPSFGQDATPSIFQNRFHMDFPRYLGGYRASLNVMVAVDEFTAENGATLMVPASHQKPEKLTEEDCRSRAVAAIAQAGSLLVFDSTLWHAAGTNHSGTDRLAINHQFTRSFLKQQLDYPRALSDKDITLLPPRSQQLLGYYTRVPASLDEFYQPEEKRFYRKYQD